jgi:hypothetical protein
MLACLVKQRLGWWKCRACVGILRQAVAGSVQMLACLVKLWLSWWKCRAYAGLLGQAKVGLVEIYGLCWHAWSSRGWGGANVGPVLAYFGKLWLGWCKCWHAWASCGGVGGNVGPMLACLVRRRLGWWKCRAYVGMLGQAEVGLVEMKGLCSHTWASCGRVGANVGPMLACLGNMRLGWLKCRAYVGMLGQAEVGLVEMKGLCWHAWASCGRVGVNVGPMLPCLGKLRTGWFKCRAYICWHAWAR